MRIVGGKFKGRILKSFDLNTTRPTSDMVREALFNILYSVTNKTFLDVFGGTGAVGLEAVSRGARQVTVIEKNKDAQKIILNNVKNLGANNIDLICDDALCAIKKLNTQNKYFDIVFIDPPYASNLAEDCLKELYKTNLIDENSIIVWEHDKTKLETKAHGFITLKTKKYGIKYLSVLTKQN